MLDNITLIAATEAKAAIDTSQSLEEQARAAMNVTKDFWLSVDENVRFNGAIAALLIVNKDDEAVVERINTEVKTLKAFGAMCAGVPVDIARALPPNDFEPIGLHRLWNEIAHPKQELP